MSRIGRKPILISDKVKVELRNDVVEVTGPLGKMSQPLPKGITIKVEKNEVLVSPVRPDDLTLRPLHGLARTLVQNAVTGVTLGFKRDLEIVGLGYRAQVAGDKLTLQLGFAHPIEFKLPAGIKAIIDPKQTAISITGVNGQMVGEVASQIRRLKKPEPYKGSGVRYAGERIIRKAGKSAAGAVGGAGGKK